MGSQDKVCMPKCKGGIGLRKTEPTNKAFQCKQAWKILTEVPSVWVRYIRYKYLHGSNLFSCIRRPTDSQYGKA